MYMRVCTCVCVLSQKYYPLQCLLAFLMFFRLSAPKELKKNIFVVLKWNTVDIFLHIFLLLPSTVDAVRLSMDESFFFPRD